MAEEIVVYISTTSSSQEIKKQQTHIQSIMESMKIPHTTADVSSDKNILTKMREIADDKTALAPQICKGAEYIGNYDAFLEAVEDKALMAFLKLE